MLPIINRKRNIFNLITNLVKIAMELSGRDGLKSFKKHPT